MSLIAFDVLELLAQGIDNGKIASRLGTSEKTVRNQVSAIFAKLGVNTRAQAIVCARDAGFGRKGSR
jgi:DNA-binding NarL/FixJ family response regulator